MQDPRDSTQKKTAWEYLGLTEEEYKALTPEEKEKLYLDIEEIKQQKEEN